MVASIVPTNAKGPGTFQISAASCKARIALPTRGADGENHRPWLRSYLLGGGLCQPPNTDCGVSNTSTNSGKHAA